MDDLIRFIVEYCSPIPYWQEELIREMALQKKLFGEKRDGDEYPCQMMRNVIRIVRPRKG